MMLSGRANSQQPLSIFVLRSCVKSPVTFGPLVSWICETRVVPYLPSIVVFFPFLLTKSGHLLLDRFEGLPRGNETDTQFVTERKVVLIKKTGIQPDHDRYPRIVPSANQRHDSPDHLLHIVAVVAVPLAPAKNRVDDFPFPNQMQRLKALHLLVCRIASLPLDRLVVIHHHRIQRQHHRSRRRQFQPPDKQFFQNPTKSRSRKDPETLRRTASWHEKKPSALREFQ